MPAQTKVEPLRRKIDFQNIYKKHKFYRTKFLRVLYRKNEQHAFRMAINISRKAESSSVKRNRARRRIRASVQTLCREKRQFPSIDAVIIPNKSFFQHKITSGQLQSQTRAFFNHFSPDDD